MAKGREWPDTWPDAVFFGIGAALGFALSFLGCLLAALPLATSLLVGGAGAIVFGVLGVVFREEVFFVLPPWN